MVKFFCDGCGKEEPAIPYKGAWIRPNGWFQRGDKDGTYDACSQECAQKINAKQGKNAPVVPI